MWQLTTSLLGFLAHRAFAHGGALNYTVGDTWYPGWDINGGSDQIDAPWLVQRSWTDTNPIFETTNASLACNTPGAPAKAYIPIRAGSNLTAVYGPWVHTVGPMLVWLASCGSDCRTVEPDKLQWFKIAEEGLLYGTVTEGEWFQRAFVRWDGGMSLWSERIPEGLRAGKYLVRHEIISLHSENKPQFYPECANLEVEGSGDSYPSGEYMAKIPGVWSMDQPEININIYTPENMNRTTYKIPGPPVWRG
ncbi:glycoside hydrolase family 61 protein [Delitschia confertaspora ATCC 74209]|uniref:AA9 family lytic polysaccharide monooxygenase n=1 Tax=Delitschia confertaspora ATCC 74209 TaxID=1513339 RepID=A0A9P4MUB3_9PLEO|nr:glycoside hydrolase family 61 protein [Delitschia confertaspora ATCC 74209]